MDSKALESSHEDPFAVIGLSFRLPEDIHQESAFWQILEYKLNLSRDWPTSRISMGSFKSQGLDAQGAHFFATDPGYFDAPFFSLTAKEAAAMDPQQRLALEVSYHAFENAGLPVQSLRGSRTAVFSATMADDYARMTSKDFDMAPQAATALQPSILPNRVSWYFDLRGPSVHIDTACSGTLTALDMACQTIRSGNCDTALVLGSNVLLNPESSVVLAQGNFLSPDSKCFSFDARANGYARGEGLVAIVIKPFRDAIRDGDVIRAVIRGIGSNQDGRTSTLTHPSSQAQEALIRHVYAQAGLDFRLTRFFEAHGTGTPVGDPIEMGAIGRVFKPYRSLDEPLYVGSVKSNIGHLEGASGGAGVIKAILALERGIIPPNALFETMNPDIDADSYHVQVPTRTVPWPSSGPRRVSVSSFGYGGTNTHVILDDALHYLQSRGISGFHHCASSPSLAGPSGLDAHIYTNGHTNGNGTKHINESTPRLLVLSASEELSAQRMAQSYQRYYQDSVCDDEAKLSQLAYTLAARRSVHPWRSFAVVESRDTFGDMSNQNSGSTPVFMSRPVRAPLEDTHVAFVFTGQGAQYPGMGMQLLQYASFEESLRKSNAIFSRLGGEWSILDELASKRRIHTPEFSQPLCTALQIALVELLHVSGVVPAAVVGHSSGEIAAAYATGALSHESACKVAYFRGQIAGKLKANVSLPGAMLSVNLSETEGLQYLRESDLDFGENDIRIACVNSPSNITLSGVSGTIDLIKADLDNHGVFAKELNTGIAYHTPTMCYGAAEYLSLMGMLEADQEGCRGQVIPMISSVTGHIVSRKQLRSPQYWVDNLISPVRFSDAVQWFTSDSQKLRLAGTITDLIEVGPHGALRKPVTDSVSSSIRYHSVLNRTQSQLRTFLKLLGTLFCYGHPVSVLAANRQARGSLPYLVDCPSYPFDHSRRYWSESRLSKDFRLRPESLGYMLGRSSHDWNPLAPRWRNWLSIETMPWLADHVISGNTICPGTAIFAMSMEAVMQTMTTDGREVSGLFCREAQFLAPITVGKTAQDAIEVMLHLKPIQSTYEKQPSKYEITIFTHREDHWKKCFSTNALQVQHHTTTTTQVDGGHENQLELVRIQRLAKQAIASCTEGIDFRDFYRYCTEHGIYYGDSFQLLRDIAWDGGRTATARIDLQALHKRHPAVDSPAHPTVLDAAFHLMVAQISKGLAEHIPTLVLQRLTNAWTSAKLWSQVTPWVRVVSVVEPYSQGLTKPIFSCYVLAEDDTPLCSFEHIYMAAVSQPGRDATPAQDQTLLYTISWKPQLSALSPKQLLRICDATAKPFDTSLIEEYYVKADHMLRLAARRGLRSLTCAALHKAPTHIRRYVAALEQYFGTPQDGEADTVSNAEFEALLDDVETGLPDYRVFSLIGRALPSILSGEVNPLELMFGSKAAESLYHFLAGDQMSDGRFKTFLDLASHETPGLRILEVGAGTGSITRHVLGDLQHLEKATGQSRFASYTFTDVSSVFFGTAKEQFGDFQNRMVFQTLDLEQEPEMQGFDLGSYDLIIAGLVLHATSDLKTSLGRLRRLLKPGGHIAIHEVTSIASPCANVTFGVLEGWWKATEDWRRYTPLATEERWAELLVETGYSGLDLLLQDHPIQAIHLCSMIVSTAVETTPIKPTLNGGGRHHPGDLVLLIDPDSDRQRRIAVEMNNRYMSTQIHLADLVDGKWTASPSDLVVCFLEFGDPRLAALSNYHFQAIQKLVQSVHNLLWVSSSTSDRGTSDPYNALATGFLRSLRSEDPTRKLITLAIESCEEGTEGNFVSTVFESSFLQGNTSAEVEYIVRGGHLVIGRLAKEIDLDIERLSRVVPMLRTEPWKAGPPLVIKVGTPGMLDTLRFVEDAAYQDDLCSDEVEIEAFAWPVSFRDVFVALGRLGQEEMGFECAGVVTRVGTGYPHDVQPGDRVVMISPGCIRTYPRASADLVVKIPDHVEMVEAVAMICPALTAHHCLEKVARLQPGEKLLVHSGAGSTGQMAIALAKVIGAEVFATVGFDEKKRFLVSRFGIPEDHIFYSRDTSFVKGVMRMTGGKGVDVVLNSLSGDRLHASWECVAPYGRFIEIGKADIQGNTSLPMASFAKNVTFAGVDMLHICQTNKSMARQLLRDTIDICAEGRLEGPAPLHKYPVSDLEKAFRYMQGGANIGRIIVTATCEDSVPKFLVDRSIWRFDPDSSYVVVGGLGGIGRAILRWMANKGAKHLLVLSRSGTASGQAAVQVVSDLADRGVHIETPRCNAASLDELTAVLRDYAARLPRARIRGCINSAMVVRDSMFGNMTHDQWLTAVCSKVNVSWNLHQSLPKDMGFFICLSSLSGIYGSPGQSNYAAGCAFQDALARHRTLTGHRGSITFDLGWVLNIGIVAESQDLRRYQKNARIMQQVEEADLFSMLDHYCNPSLPPLDAEHTQMLIGVFTHVHFHTRHESPSPYLDRPLFSAFDAPHLWTAAGSSYLAGVSVQDSAAMLFRQASTLRDRSAVVVEATRAKLARSLGIGMEDVDPRNKPSDYGTDSLMAVELRNWIMNDFGHSIAVFEIMGGNNILAIGELVAGKAEG